MKYESFTRVALKVDVPQPASEQTIPLLGQGGVDAPSIKCPATPEWRGMGGWFNGLNLSRRVGLFGLFSLFLLLLGAGTIRSVIVFALDFENSHASQILIIPFVSAGLIWLKRKAVFENPRSSVLPGATAIVLGSV